MKIRQLLLVGVLFIFFIDANAQFKIDAQFRTRGQALHGYKRPIPEETDAAFHVGQRTRLNFSYNTKKFSSLISIQDIRTWGDANIVVGTGVQGKSYNNLDIYEAWVNYKFNKISNIRIGRQEMKYDDQRHISWRNWWDSGLTYDAVTFTHNNNETGWRWDLSASYNSRDSFRELTGNDYSGVTDYFGIFNPIQTQSFFYLKKNIKNKMYISFTAIATGYQKEGTKNTIYITGTEGLHFNYNTNTINVGSPNMKVTDGFFGVANAFIQNGTNIQGKKIEANMITAQFGYRTMEKKLEISAKMERLSGHDAKNTDTDYNNTVHTYNLLYGARHPYYGGFLDWFVLPKSTGNGGLFNLGLSLKYNLTSKDAIWFEYNNISTVKNAKSIVNNNDEPVFYYDGNLANTIDLTYARKVVKNVKWMTGFSYGIPSDGFNKLWGINKGGTNYTFYTMVIFTPKFFDSSKFQKIPK